jgi:hypothetical protein
MSRAQNAAGDLLTIQIIMARIRSEITASGEIESIYA